MFRSQERNFQQNQMQPPMRLGQQRKPARVSITNLADELLQNILGFLVDCDKKVYDNGGSDIHGMSSSRRALRLSGTCRAFRNALLHMPGAWVVVSSEHPGEMILTMCVQRSSSRGLRLYHANFRGYDRVVKLLRHLLSLQALGRVRIDIVSLEIDVGHSSWSGAPLSPQEEMAQLLGKLDNQALSVLNVHYFKNFRYSSVDDGLEADNNGEDELDDVEVEMNGGLPYELRNLMQSPHLQSAHFQNTIPPPGMMTSLSKLVLELQIHATYDSDDDDDDPDKWAVQNLLDLLRSQPTLEDLALEFYDTGSLGFNNANDNRLELPCVKTFSLHWHGNTNFDGRMNYRSSSIPRLFKLLDLKNVEVFRFRIQSESVEDYARGTDHELPLLLDDHLKFFLGGNAYFPRLESFYLKFYSSNENFLYLPTSYIRNIKHLSLDINIKLSLEDLYGDRSNSQPLLPHLRTITLHNCDELRTSTIKAILEAIKAGGNWEGFQQLVVDDCRYLSDPWVSTQLQSLVGPGKLTVYRLTRIFRNYYE